MAALLLAGMLAALLAVVCLQAMKGMRAAHDAGQRAGEAAREALERFVLKHAETQQETMHGVLMLKGLEPHHAAPNVMSPSGVPWNAIDRMQAAPPVFTPEPAPVKDDSDEYELIMGAAAAAPNPLLSAQARSQREAPDDLSS